jgi:hypothetical protein
METETGNRLPFLNVLVVRNRLTPTTKVYRKHAHMGHYLTFKLNHSPYVTRGTLQSLHSTALYIFQDKQVFLSETVNLR